MRLAVAAIAVAAARAAAAPGSDADTTRCLADPTARCAPGGCSKASNFTRACLESRVPWRTPYVLPSGDAVYWSCSFRGRHQQSNAAKDQQQRCSYGRDWSASQVRARRLLPLVLPRAPRDALRPRRERGALPDPRRGRGRARGRGRRSRGARRRLAGAARRPQSRVDAAARDAARNRLAPLRAARRRRIPRRARATTSWF